MSQTKDKWKEQVLKDYKPEKEAHYIIVLFCGLKKEIVFDVDETYSLLNLCSALRTYSNQCAGFLELFEFNRKEDGKLYYSGLEAMQDGERRSIEHEYWCTEEFLIERKKKNLGL